MEGSKVFFLLLTNAGSKDRSDTSLVDPPQHGLVFAPTTLFANLLNHWVRIVHDIVAHGITKDLNAKFLGCSNDLGLLAAWMEFNLIACWHYACVALHFFENVCRIVGYANHPCLSSLVSLFKCFPRLGPDLVDLIVVDAHRCLASQACLAHQFSHVIAVYCFEWADWNTDKVSALFVSPCEEMRRESCLEFTWSSEWRMDQKQVNVVSFQLFQAQVDGFRLLKLDVVVVPWVNLALTVWREVSNLRSERDILSFESSGLDTCGIVHLVAVKKSSINVSNTLVKCTFHAKV